MKRSLFAPALFAFFSLVYMHAPAQAIGGCDLTGGQLTSSTKSITVYNDCQDPTNVPQTPTLAPTTTADAFPENSSFDVKIPLTLWDGSYATPTHFDVYESRNGQNYTKVGSVSVLSKTMTISRSLGTSGYAYYKYKSCAASGCSGFSPVKQITIGHVQPPAGNNWHQKGGSAADAPIPSPISMPSTNFWGYQAGQPSVSGGSASYSVPITVVPGRANMQPNIALNYSSRSGNGIAGVGWSLNAGGAISRCPATLAQDNKLGSIQFSTTNDKLCFNGQRLINISGAYGNANTVYKLEMDDQTRVTQKTGNLDHSSTFFEVQYASGAKSFFGLAAAQRVTPANTTETQTWLISREQDVSGANNINYYYDNFGYGELLLGEIRYTGYNGADGNRSVHFEYEDRPVKSSSFVWGTETRTSKRLRKITTKYGSSTVRAYTLVYQLSDVSGRSLLKRVEECGYQHGTQCVKFATYNYSDDVAVVDFEPLSFGSGMAFPGVDDIFEALPRGDVNGDGVRDWSGVFVNAEGQRTGTSNVDLKPCYRNYLMTSPVCVDADFNKDGLTDDWRDNNNRLEIRYTGESNWRNTGIVLDKRGAYGSNYQDGHIKHVADYNGDGWPDLMVYSFNSFYPQIRLHLHTKNLSAPYPATGTLIFQYSTNSGSTGNLTTSTTTNDIQFMGDMDGNGHPDMVIADKGLSRYGLPIPQPRPYQIWYNNGSGTSYNKRSFTYSAGTSVQPEAYFTYFIDLNADGLSDWIGWYESGSSAVPPKMVGRLNKGNGQFSNQFDIGGDNLQTVFSFTLLPGDSDVSAYMPKYGSALQVADIDGDGTVEILEPGNRLVTGCSVVLSYNHPNGQTKCGDALYTNYRVDYDSVARIDADKKDDSIYQWNAYHIEEDANGNFTLRKEVTDFVGHAYQTSMVDAFGTGLPSMVTVHRKQPSTTFSNNGSGTAMQGHFGNYGVYISRNRGSATGSERYHPHDLLREVTDSRGTRGKWTYRPLSSDEFDTASDTYYDMDSQYTGQFTRGNGEYLHFASSMYTVAKFEQNNGVSGFNTSLYRYKGAVFNTNGRGFMGFRDIIVEDQEAGITSHTRFSQKFPIVNRVEELKVYQTGRSNPFETVTNTWVETDAHDAVNPDSIYHVHNLRSIKRVYDINNLSHRLSETVTTVWQSGIDAYGNVTDTTTSHTDAYGVKTKRTDAYFSPTAAWPHKNLWSRERVYYSPTSLVVAKHTDTQLEKAVTTRIDSWDTIHRKPKRVTRAMGTSALSRASCNIVTPNGCTATTTLYNTFGLPYEVQIVGATYTGISDSKNIATRVVKTNYTDNGTSVSSAGYFPFEIRTNSGTVEHKQKVLTNPRTGQPLTVYDANNIYTQTTYDSLGRVVQVQQQGMPAQYVRYRTVDSDGSGAKADFMTMTYQHGAPSTKTYVDRFGRTTRSAVEGFDGTFTFSDVKYDTLGRTTHESAPYSSGSPIYTVYSGFDVLGRVGQKLTPATEAGEDFTTNYIYSGYNTTITVNAPQGNNLVMSRIYDSLGQLIETTDADNGRTRYAYDAAGNPIVIQDASENSIYAGYDNLSRKLWVRDPNQGLTRFTYNDFGELEKEIDANNEWIRYDMDHLGRVTNRWSVDGNATFVFDTFKKGTLRTETAPGFQRTYEYDALARPTKVITSIHGTTYEMTTAYDGYFGRPKSISYPNNLTIEMVYNGRGYLEYERNAASKFVYRHITEHDAFGNITGSSLNNDSLSQTAIYSLRTGQMLNNRVRKGFTNLHYQDYEDYDSYGNIVRQNNLVSSVNHTDTFVYDELQRMTRSTVSSGSYATSIDYSYDAVGNMLRKTDYSANQTNAYVYTSGTNRLASVKLLDNSTDTFAYDAKGNLTHRNNKVEFIYNVFNKPTSVNRHGSAVSFEYDSTWQRYRQVGTVGGVSTQTHYIGKMYEVEIQGLSRKTTAYISDVAIITESGNDQQIRFTHKDRLGSSTTFTDHNNIVTAFRAYDPFGKPRMGDGSLMSSLGLRARLAHNVFDSDGLSVTRRGFTDHEHLDEVEIIHMNGRVYDYNLARFMSVDPFIHNGSQGINPYSYILNNPLAGTDPTGYTPEAANTESERKLVATTAGSRIKRTITVTVSESNGSTEVNVSGGSGSSVWGAMNSIAGGIESGISNMSADIGSQGTVAANNSQIKSEGSIQLSVTASDGDEASDTPEVATTPSSDVKGNEETDALAIAYLEPLEGSGREQMRIFKSNGENVDVTGSSCNNLGCETSVPDADVPLIILVAHLHVDSDHPLEEYAKAITKKRELPGPKDESVLIQLGIPNYFKTPTGAIRVLEYYDESYHVRTLRGEHIDSSWKPSDADLSRREISKIKRRMR